MVVSETLNGEAIIMHHGSGHYFNTIGTGALIWEAIEGGVTPERAAERLAAASGAGSDRALEAVLRFVETLDGHGLIRAGDGNGAAPPPSASLAYAEPELHVHLDLADMLLLDPVHDVDEGGWPAPARVAQERAPWSG